MYSIGRIAACQRAAACCKVSLRQLAISAISHAALPMYQESDSIVRTVHNRERADNVPVQIEDTVQYCLQRSGVRARARTGTGTGTVLLPGIAACARQRAGTRRAVRSTTNHDSRPRLYPLGRQHRRVPKWEERPLTGFRLPCLPLLRSSTRSLESVPCPHRRRRYATYAYRRPSALLNLSFTHHLCLYRTSVVVT